MRDLVVTPRGGLPAIRALLDINHGASLEDDGSYYVWCYGHANPTVWRKSEEGAPVTCLWCIAYGPREDWHRRNPYGQRGREEMHEGTRYLVFDTETSGRGY